MLCLWTGTVGGVYEGKGVVTTASLLSSDALPLLSVPVQ